MTENSCLCIISFLGCPSGEIGRRTSFRCWRLSGREGSSPFSGTNRILETRRFSKSAGFSFLLRSMLATKCAGTRTLLISDELLSAALLFWRTDRCFRRGAFRQDCSQKTQTPGTSLHGACRAARTTAGLPGSHPQHRPRCAWRLGSQTNSRKSGCASRIRDGIRIRASSTVLMTWTKNQPIHLNHLCASFDGCETCPLLQEKFSGSFSQPA